MNRIQKLFQSILFLSMLLSMQLFAATQEFKLNANDASAEAYFGSSVSVSENTAVVGAYNTFNDDESNRDGAVYIYEFNGSLWEQVDKLLPNSVNGGDQFGYSVSISNNRMAIGAPKSRVGGSPYGSVHIYEYDGNNWVFAEQLTASDAGNYDSFGISVSLNGERLVVGASNNFETGIGSGTGSAYVFEFDGTDWNETQKLLASDASASSSFGIFTALEGNRIVIGASSVDDSEIGNNLGAVYVFELNESMWTETTILTAIDRQTNDKFGNVLSLSGDTILVGSNESAFIFEYNSNTSSWDEGLNLVTEDNMANDRFGFSVTINGNKALVGAPQDDTDNDNYTGSVYAFSKNANNNWIQSDFITHIDSPLLVGDYFGSAVALDGNRAIIGSNRDDNGGTQTFDTGAAYIFDVDVKPEAVNDTLTLDEDSQWTNILVLSNDTDLDGGPIFIESFTQPNNGEIDNESNILSYKPSENYCNSNSGSDSVTYTLNGGSIATVTLNVTCVDDAPVAVSDSSATTEDSDAITIQVLQNDTDIDEGTLNIVSITQPTNGVVINNSTSLSYQPNPNYCNTDTTADDFTYTLNGNSSTTVSIDVECVDDLPIAVADFASVYEDSHSNIINILDNDTDIDDGPIFIAEFSQPNNGDVFDNNFSLNYRPDANYCNQGNATDDFTYNINNNSTTDVFVEVKCVNDQPSFMIIGDIVTDATLLNQSQLVVANFANNFVFGPDNESSQQVMQFITEIQADDSDVIDSINIENNGTLEINFTQNPGVAIVNASMQDNDGIENGGIDTSNSVVFYVTFSDTIFSSRFEQPCCLRVENLLNELAQNNPDMIVPRYDFYSNSIEFYGYVFELSQGYPNNPDFKNIKQWLNAILRLVNPESELNM